MPSLVRIALILSLAMLLLAGAAAGILFGLAGSEAGTRWLAAQAERWTDGVIEWQDIEGTLLGSLQLQAVRVSQPGLDIELKSLTLDWQPRALLQGQIQIDGLTAEGIRIALAPTKPSALGEPFDPAALQLPVGVSLQGIRLRDLQLIQADQPAQLISEVDLDAQLENGELTIQHLAISLAQGGLTLSGSTALRNPMPLELQTAWNWRLPTQDTGTLTATAPKDDLTLEGTLALEGSLEWSEAIGFRLRYRVNASGLGGLNLELPTQVDAKGELRGQYRGVEITLDQLSVALTGMTLGLQGKLSLPEDADPSFDVTLQWADLQWPLAASEPDVSSAKGKLHLTGSTKAYNLELAADLVGKDIPQSEWRGQGKGDLSRLELSQLRGSLLGGGLSISGPVEWDPVPRWELRLEGSGLDPGLLIPEFPGELTIALSSSGQLDPERGLQAGIDLEQLTGTLMGYAMDLKARASLIGEEVQLDSLLLESNGNRLSASGQLSADVLALDWQLWAAAPDALVPGASGLISARGTVEGNPEAPRLQAQLEGRELRWKDLSIQSLNATLEAGLAADDKLRMDVATGSVEDGDRRLLESLSLRARGTASEHTLIIELTTGKEQLNARLEGGLDQQFSVWQGMLAQFDLQSEEFGRWRLFGESALSLAADTATLGNSCLKHDTSSAQLCAQAHWSKSGNSKLKAELQALPIELLTPVLTGEVAGKMDAGLASDGAILAEASFGITPGLVVVELEEGAKKLAHGGGNLDLSIGSTGLTGNLVFAAPEQGQVKAGLLLPALNGLPLVEKQPLSGYIQASLPDLGGLAGWVPELSSSAGQLEADLQLAGTLYQPELLGEVALTEGAADIPMAGLKLRQIELRALSNPSRPGLWDVTGGMESGPGRVDLSGQLDMADSTLALQVKGEHLQVYNTQDVLALLSPDLEIGWSDETLKLRGQLLIPRADITPKLGISPSMLAEDPDTMETPGQIIGPSPDVVVVNAPQEAIERARQPAAPFRIDSQVQLILGDRVKVNTLGFISRITGAVTFTNRPDQRELIPMANGRLSVEDGTFRAFGQDLDIETGQLIFADVPATEPELNVRAVRWIDNDPQVTAAGVLITGSVTEPTLELFSRPQLEASEVQSYLLTGRSSADKDDVLSIGTYLNPRTYVGYGYNLLEKTSEFNSLFSITPRYGIGANLGEADNNINLTFTYEK